MNNGGDDEKDIFEEESLLKFDLERREIFLFGTINKSMHFFMLDSFNQLEFPKKGISIFINSKGGDLDSTLAIYDLLISKQNPFKVMTVCTGIAASGAALIFQAGNIRRMYKHSKLMLHAPAWMPPEYLKIEDFQKILKEMKKSKKEFMEIIAEKTSKDLKDIMKDIKKGDKYFTAEEAVKYGLADEIV